MRTQPNTFRALIVLLAAFLALVAGPLQAADKQLSIGMGADVTSIDPHYANIAPNNAAAWHVFEALTHVDADTRLVPGLATSWRALDPTTWEFVLRKGVRFHDGSPFDARDVEFSIRRAESAADTGRSREPQIPTIPATKTTPRGDAYTVKSASRRSEE